MAKIKIPYHKDYLEIEVSEKNLKAVLYPDNHKPMCEVDQNSIILKAMNNPIGTGKLSSLAAGKNKVLVITSDHTRGVPSKLTLPVILEEIRKGNPGADITILIAAGLHRETTKAEQRAMFGDNIVDNEKIICHDAFDEENMRFVCDLPSGARFCVNKLVLETDMLVTEGFVEPHFFAGFSGGRKSILPGVSSAETINTNHCAAAIAHANSITGVLAGNVIHEDMLFAAKKVGVDFMLNVALDADKKVIAAFAGDISRAHEEACSFVLGMAGVDRVYGDIVVTSNGGYPLDQNLYQSSKGISTAKECAGEGAVIIMVSSCIEGMGGEYFGELILSGEPEEILQKLLSAPGSKTIPEQWCVQILCNILLKHKIILVSDYLDHETVRKAGMIPANTPDEALKIAYGLTSADASVVVIPDGVAAVIK